MFLLLELLARHGTMGVTALSREAHLSKGTVSRYLDTLTALGYVRREAGGVYTLTARILTLSGQYLCRLDPVETALPFVRRLAEETGETAHLACRDNTVVRYVATYGDHGLPPREGETLPLYCTAAGKALLSTLSDSDVRSVWKTSDIRPLTPRTVVDLPALLGGLRAVREAGIAHCDGEWESGVYSIAAAVHDYTGQCPYALVLCSTCARFTPERIAALLPLLEDAREQLETQWGYVPKSLAPEENV